MDNKQKINYRGTPPYGHLVITASFLSQLNADNAATPLIQPMASQTSYFHLSIINIIHVCTDCNCDIHVSMKTSLN